MALGESNDSFGVVTRRQAREIIKINHYFFIPVGIADANTAAGTVTDLMIHQ